MIIGTVIQQPGETLDYDIVYTPFFYSHTINAIDDSIRSDGFSVKVFPVGPVGIGFRLSDDRAKVWLSGGVSGVTYTVTLTMKSTSNRIKEDEILMIVEEF
jgi:hypothetical protein